MTFDQNIIPRKSKLLHVAGQISSCFGTGEQCLSYNRIKVVPVLDNEKQLVEVIDRRQLT